MRKFDNGGLSKAQEEYLGGADRTDPYIMARMRRAVPDEPKAATAMPKVDTDEIRDETGTVSKIKRNTETGDIYSTEVSKTKVTPKKEAVDSKTEVSTPKVTPSSKAESKPEVTAKKTTVQEFKESLKTPNIARPYKKSDIEKPKSKTDLIELKFGSLTKKLREKAGITSYKSGGKVKSASSRADGCAVRGKTRA